MPETRHFRLHDPVKTAHILAARLNCQLRQAGIRAGDQRSRILQHLVIRRAQAGTPVGARIIEVGLARQQPLRAGRDGARKIARIIVVRGGIDIPSPRQPGRQRLRMGRCDRVAIGLRLLVVGQEFKPCFTEIRLAQVTPMRAQLQTAARNDIRVQRQIAVGRDVDIIWHRDFEAALVGSSDRWRQHA